MRKTTRPQTDRETQRVNANREELVERIAASIRVDGDIQPFQGLYLSRQSIPHQNLHGALEPSLCVIAQGSKEILLGDSRYRYDPLHYLLATIDVPSVGRIVEASRARPYLGLRVQLPAPLVSSVMAEAGQAASTAPAIDVRAIDVCGLDADLLDAVIRLVRLVDHPTQAPILMPLITREIVYRLLMGHQGDRLRHQTVSGGHAPAIARAVQRLRQDFDKPLRVEQLARDLGMSVSGFHRHFKTVTAITPLQFLKRVRLQEARRLMLGEDLDAAHVAQRVGYGDASHFSREYKSVFGMSPMRDVKKLRKAAHAHPDD